MKHIQFSSTGDGSEAANCHSVRVSLKNEPKELLSRWQELVGQIATAGTNVNAESIWIERVNDDADSIKAQALVTKECYRPVVLCHHGLRANLLIFNDNRCDLILVADQRAVDKAALMTLLQALLEDKNEGSVSNRLSPLGLSCETMIKTHNEKYHGQNLRCKPSLGMNQLLAAIAYTLQFFDCHDQDSLGYYQTSPSSCCPLTAQAGADISADQWALDIASQIKKSTDATLALADFNCAIISDIDDYLDAENIIAWQYLPLLAPAATMTWLIVKNAEQVFNLNLIVQQSRFKPAQVKRILTMLENLLVTDWPQERPFSYQSDYLGKGELQKIAALGRSDFSERIPFRIDQQIYRLAQTLGDKVAVSDENGCISYRQLDDYANQVARGLMARGVKNGAHIGLCLPRDMRVVVYMLAILKVGAVYVPVDPDYPRSRIGYTCTDAQLLLVITELNEIPEMAVDQVIDSESFWQHCQDLSNEPVEVADLSVEDAAYIIYTSGSTGKPKGVVVPHKNLSCLINATIDDFGLNSKDIWTLFHSIAFDFSVWEIWGCLLTGGELVIVPYWTSRKTDEFACLLKDKGVTIVNQTPSAFGALVKENECNPIGDNLRLVIFGGETLDTRSLLPWFDCYPETQCRLVNMYGITETTVHVTSETITRRHCMSNSRIVGRALLGWSVYILDDKQQMLPPGVAGEIYVGGAGVAMHYHGKKELTAERFVGDPFYPGIIYQSGDKGMLLEDGRLVHLGRFDDQIKLRGFRIELGEIRNSLLALPGVSAVAVTFSQHDPHDPASARLDTYVVLDGIDVSDVASFARQVLPSHMQSSSYCEVSQIPLTVNGKLDTKKIAEKVVHQQKVEIVNYEAQAPSSQDMSESGQIQSPEQNLTQQMLSIWQNVLNKPVTKSDNFFDLGGNSLYAIRIATEMKEKNLPMVNLRELYMYQTIENLAQALAGQGGN